MEDAAEKCKDEKRTLEIGMEGDEIHFKGFYITRTVDVKFKLGEEFEEKSAQGVVVKVSVCIMLLSYSTFNNP